MKTEDLLKRTAAAFNETELKQILNTAGITDFSDDALHSAYRILEFSRKSREMMAVFMKEYCECEALLAEYGIVLTPGEYDLMRDVISCTVDASLGNQLNRIRDISSAAAVLKTRGYYHITEEFLKDLVQYARLPVPADLMDEEKSAGFLGRVEKNITYLAAGAVITALRSGQMPAVRPADLIAAAGGYELIQKRMKSSKTE